MAIAILRFADLPAGFVDETKLLLHGRVRAAALLVLFLHLVFLPLDFVRYPEFASVQAGLRSAVCVVLVAIAATIVRVHDLSSLRLAIAFFVGVAVLPVVSLVRFAYGPDDPRYIEQLVPLTYAIMGVALFFPLGGRATLVIGGVPVLLHALATIDFPPASNLPLVLLSLSALAVSAVGSEGALRARLGDYEGRLAKDALIRARGDTAAMISHDLKNPLGAILGAVQLHREEVEDAGPVVDTLDRIEAAARRALLLVTNFLDASRLGDGRVEPRRRTVDLATSVIRVAAEQRALGAIKDVRIEAVTDPEPLHVEVDEGQIDRVLANLIHNSIQHSPFGGNVLVRARHVDDAVEVVVEDEGEGISEAAFPRLFDRFSSAASRVDSTGLGLYVVKTLVEAHGGTVTAENRAPDRGARFRMRLAPTPRVN